jgi:hypothetical protein
VVSPGPKRVHSVHDSLVLADDFADVPVQKLRTARRQRLALKPGLVRSWGLIIPRLAPLFHRLVLQNALRFTSLDGVCPGPAVLVQIALGFEGKPTGSVTVVLTTSF